MTDLAIQPVVCVLGYPIAGNPMQFAIERALSAADLDWRFLSLDVSAERLPAAIAGIEALGFVGASIATPHGSLAATLVSRLSPEAVASRWVDCLSRDHQGVLTGHNLLSHCLADAAQIDSLATDELREPTAVLVGSCESAVAACAPLVRYPLKRWLLTHLDPSALEVHQRTAQPQTAAGAVDESRAAPDASAPADAAGPPAAAASEQARSRSDSPAACSIRRARSLDAAITDQTRLIVRSSLPGGQPAEIPEALLDRLSPPAVVVDLAVASSTSPLARAAQQRGLRGLNRLDLLIARAATALQLWTGQQADADVLREAFEEYLEI